MGLIKGDEDMTEVKDVNGENLKVGDLVIIVKDYCTELNKGCPETLKRYKRGFIGKIADYSTDEKNQANAVWFYNPLFICGDRIFPDEMGGAISWGRLNSSGCDDYNGFCPSAHLMKLDEKEVTQFMIKNWSIKFWINYLNEKGAI